MARCLTADRGGRQGRQSSGDFDRSSARARVQYSLAAKITLTVEDSTAPTAVGFRKVYVNATSYIWNTISLTDFFPILLSIIVGLQDYFGILGKLTVGLIRLISNLGNTDKST